MGWQLRDERRRVADLADHLCRRVSVFIEERKVKLLGNLFSVGGVDTFVQFRREDRLEERRRDGDTADLAYSTEELAKPSSDRQSVLCTTVSLPHSDDARTRDNYGVYALEGRLRE